MAPDILVKLAVYRHFAETGRRPDVSEVAGRTGLAAADVLAAYRSLRAQRMLLLEADGANIRMAPPFSGVSTQHRVEVEGVGFFANCAWDALGVLAALRRAGRVHSRCEQSGEPLDLAVRVDGPEDSSWRFHCLVPASRWWDDLVFT
jgi:alkylmercury lyase-like protein